MIDQPRRKKRRKSASKSRQTTVKSRGIARRAVANELNFEEDGTEFGESSKQVCYYPSEFFFRSYFEL